MLHTNGILTPDDVLRALSWCAFWRRCLIHGAAREPIDPGPPALMEQLRGESHADER